MRSLRARGKRCVGLLAATLMLSVLAGCTGSSAHRAANASATTRPNIVFVLTDDLTMNLLPYMPHVLQMQKSGVSFSNYTVADSLCCPSRSSIFTGMYPHNTKIFTNSAPDGGYVEFRRRGEEDSTFAVALHNSGYKTALMGKYLNGYEAELPRTGVHSYIPPGWDQFDAVGDRGYSEYRYAMSSVSGGSHWYGSKPEDYLTNVLRNKATDFIHSAAASGSPFMLEVATYAPHIPYIPAPQDRKAFPGLKAPQTAAFNTVPQNAPAWLRGHAPLTRNQRDLLNESFRKRAQAVQSVDRMIGAIETALSTAGVSENTILIFSSDNGFHLGEYRLMAGKMTAFDTDVNVPLVATGPGIPSGVIQPELTQNIDLAPTFEKIAGLQPASTVDGRSLLPLLHGESPTNWPTAALVEHRGPDHDVTDPDFPPADSGNPPSYNALRTATFTYVEYVTGEDEYYDRTTDPYELDNIVGQLSIARRAQLHAELEALVHCQGTVRCETARSIPVVASSSSPSPSLSSPSA